MMSQKKSDMKIKIPLIESVNSSQTCCVQKKILEQYLMIKKKGNHFKVKMKMTTWKYNWQ